VHARGAPMRGAWGQSQQGVEDINVQRTMTEPYGFGGGAYGEPKTTLLATTPPLPMAPAPAPLPRARGPSPPPPPRTAGGGGGQEPLHRPSSPMSPMMGRLRRGSSFVDVPSAGVARAMQREDSFSRQNEFDEASLRRRQATRLQRSEDGTGVGPHAGGRFSETGAERWSGLVRSLDAFPKVRDEEFFERTMTGGVLTVGALAVMALLFVAELGRFLSVEKVHQLVVDTERSADLEISFDVTVPRMPCSWLTVDVMDAVGDSHMDVDHHVTKFRLDSRGNTIELYGQRAGVGERSGIDLGDKAAGDRERALGNAENTEGDGDAAGEKVCGSCHGARPSTECCNTCDEVLNAFKAKGWAVNPRAFTQCQDPDLEESIRAQLGEGCRLVGKVSTARVGGNLHIAPGRSNYSIGAHMHDLEVFRPDAQFDFSHTINLVRFGDDLPGISHPLDGLEQVLDT